MKSFKFFLVIILATLLGLNSAQAATRVQECFTLLKAQDYSRAVQTGRQATRETPQDGDAHYCLGAAYRLQGDFDSALRSLQQAERLFTSRSDLRAVYAQLGMVATRKGDLQQALNYHSRELALARETGRRSDEATALNNIALIFSDRGDSNKALDYLQQSLNIEPEERSKASRYNNMAMIYAERDENDKAVEYLEKALQINRRYGDYHGAARNMLNKGAVLTDMGKLDEADATLREGLTAIQKVGDKYWEAVAYQYLGALGGARRDAAMTLQNYKEALRLAQLAGATALAEQVARTIDMQQKRVTALSYGVIEIGSKGVKAATVTSSRDENGRTKYETGFRHSINTNIIQGVSDSGEFSPEAIKETVDAVKLLMAGIKLSSPGWNNTITIAGSSALAGAMNRYELVDKIRVETGITPIFINSAQELSYAIKGSTSADRTYKTALLDIGSGNGRIGYLISPRGGRPAGEAVVDLRAGSVTLAELANKARKPSDDYVSALNRVVEQDLQPKFASDIRQYPVVRRHNHFLLVGGAAWAMSTLMHPENRASYVPLSRKDIADYWTRLSQDPQSLLEQDLRHITDDKVKAQAEKEIASVKKVFTLENLQAGARLLKMVADADPFGNASIHFAREGNWAYGLAEAQALVKQ